MKSVHVDFHIDKKKGLFITVLCSLISSLLCLLMVLSTSQYLAQLKTLWRSVYDYSAITIQPIGKDDYYQFDAGISFALSSDSDIRLNANVLMQVDNSEYTNMVCWNANKLSSFGVAISRDLAIANDLCVGDKLYSKHTVNGEICEYLVEQILPTVSILRDKSQKNIIIMGYDSQYVDNISHVVVVYTDEPIEELSQKYTATLENILYRDDEIISVCKVFAPYVATFALLSILNIIGLTFFLTRGIAQNFRRLMILGFSSHEMDRSYNNLICGLGCISILFTAMMLAVVLYSISLLEINMTLLIPIFLVDFLALLITAAFCKGQLWRK